MTTTTSLPSPLGEGLGMRYLLGMITLFLLLSIRSNAQAVYPVTANIQLTPPYTVYMSDFVSPASNKLFVSLLFNDLADPMIDVYLRFTIEGVGVTIQNGIDFRPSQPIHLQSGTLERLDASLLATYFDPNNLIFQGYTRQQYQRSAALPEGFYKISVQVYEFTTGVLISNKATYSAWLMLNDPPRVVSPVCGDKIRLLNPQNIVFQWAPMHMASPVTGEETEYYVKVVEILPAGRNPNDAILSSVPVFEFTTENSSFLYGMDDPLLIPGHQYAWRVQARYKNGKSMFKNDGYSEVCYFTYGDPCTPPADIISTVQNAQRVNIGWTAFSSADGYTLRYKEKNNSAANWYENQVTTAGGLISGITSNTTYEYQVQTTCGSYQSGWSTIDTFKTAASAIPTQCGVAVAITTASTADPLMNLLSNDVVTVDGFKVRIIQSSGANGIYTGSGVAYIPFLSAYIKMTFSGITINKEFIVTQGRMVAVKSNKVALYKTQVQPKEYREICTGGDNGNTNPRSNNSSQNGNTSASNGSSSNTSGSKNTMILNDSIVVHEGDTITINGQSVVVDQNTRIKAGDVVVVNGKTITVKSVVNAGTFSAADNDLLKNLVELIRNKAVDTINARMVNNVNYFKRITSTGLDYTAIESSYTTLYGSSTQNAPPPVSSQGSGAQNVPGFSTPPDNNPEYVLTQNEINLFKADPAHKKIIDTLEKIAVIKYSLVNDAFRVSYLNDLLNEPSSIAFYSALKEAIIDDLVRIGPGALQQTIDGTQPQLKTKIYLFIKVGMEEYVDIYMANNYE